MSIHAYLTADQECTVTNGHLAGGGMGKESPEQRQMNSALRLYCGATIIVLLISVFVSSYSWADSSEATRLLEARNAEFEQEIITVTDNVYTAVGFSVQPVTMIEGDTGVVIVDSGIDTESAALVLTAFRNITTKPIKALILTHGHGDHTGGASVFIETPEVEVWAHENFGAESHRLKSSGLTIDKERGGHQAGMFAPFNQRINNGIAKNYRPKTKRDGNMFHTANIEPSHRMTMPRQRLLIAGIEIDLVDAPGETTDQMYVWLPKQKVIFSGDNFYKSWPNIYPLRGTPYRDVDLWCKSLDAMLKEGPHYLIPGHTRPILGKKSVTEVLTNYRDAIRFVFDKTIEGMNKGLGPDELVDYVQLPEKYINKDYLRPYYGHPEWAVRAIFNAYLGWYDGNPSNLFSLAPIEEAKRVAALAGGLNALQNEAGQALAQEDFQWAAQVSDYLIVLQPEEMKHRELKADALTALAEQLLTATGRNYYFSVAEELRRSAEIEN